MVRYGITPLFNVEHQSLTKWYLENKTPPSEAWGDSINILKMVGTSINNLDFNIKYKFLVNAIDRYNIIVEW